MAAAGADATGNSPSVWPADLLALGRLASLAELPTPRNPLDPACLPPELARTGVTFIILYSMMASVLFVCTLAFMLRNVADAPLTRTRAPIVFTLGMAMLLCLLGSVLNTVFWATLLIRDHVSNLVQAPNFWLATTTMLFVTPLVTHVALVFRMMTFYPPMLARGRQRYGVIVLPIVLKLARIPLLALYLHSSFQRVRAMGYRGFDQGLSDEWNSSFALAEVAVMLADCIYATAFLSYQFHKLGDGARRKRTNTLLERRSSWLVDVVRQTVAATLFTFIVPTLWTVALLACIASPRVSPTKVGYMLVANVFVHLYFSTAACLSRSGGWRERRYVTAAPDMLGEKEARRASQTQRAEGFWAGYADGLAKRRAKQEKDEPVRHHTVAEGKADVVDEAEVAESQQQSAVVTESDEDEVALAKKRATLRDDGELGQHFVLECPTCHRPTDGTSLSHYGSPDGEKTPSGALSPKTSVSLKPRRSVAAAAAAATGGAAKNASAESSPTTLRRDSEPLSTGSASSATAFEASGALLPGVASSTSPSSSSSSAAAQPPPMRTSGAQPPTTTTTYSGSTPLRRGSNSSSATRLRLALSQYAGPGGVGANPGMAAAPHPALAAGGRSVVDDESLAAPSHAHGRTASLRTWSTAESEATTLAPSQSDVGLGLGSSRRGSSSARGTTSPTTTTTTGGVTTTTTTPMLPTRPSRSPEWRSGHETRADGGDDDDDDDDDEAGLVKARRRSTPNGASSRGWTPNHAAAASTTNPDATAPDWGPNATAATTTTARRRGSYPSTSTTMTTTTTAPSSWRVSPPPPLRPPLPQLPPPPPAAALANPWRSASSSSSLSSSSSSLRRDSRRGSAGERVGGVLEPVPSAEGTPTYEGAPPTHDFSS